MILTDDNFATIERAMEEGRGVYENIKKFSNFFCCPPIFGGNLPPCLQRLRPGLASPLKPSHILWINLITDSLPALALGVDENDGRRLMEKPPRQSGESLFAGGGWFVTLGYGFSDCSSQPHGSFSGFPWSWLVPWSFRQSGNVCRIRRFY